MWFYATLTLVSDDHAGGRVILAPDRRSDERLRIVGEGALAALTAAVPRLSGHRTTRGFGRSAVVAGAIVAVLAAFWFGYPVLKDGIVAVFPPSWSDKIGREMTADQAFFGGPCTGAAGLAALDGLTQRLSAKAGLPEPIRVHVRSSGQVNAFASTGGHIVLLDGLIQQAETPEEVAGVLAHEIGHVKHRHPLKRLIDVAGIQVIVSAVSGDVGAVGTTLLMLNYGRKDEAQADRTALDLMDRADIAGGGLADFFDRMQEKHEGRPDFIPFLETHPPLGDRSAVVRGHRQNGAITPALTAKEWRALREVCVGAAKPKFNPGPER
ncbi:MAG: M48 family metallopeptidase [Sphingomonadales bacterium]